MIGKLIIIGVIVAAAGAFFMPGISNVIPNFPSLEAISERVSPEPKPENQYLSSPQDEIKPLSLDQVDPKYTKKEIHTGQVFEKSDGKCKISVPSLAETINGKKELTHVLDLEDCPYELGQAVEITKLEAKEDIHMPVSSLSSITVNSHPVADFSNIVQLTSSHKGNDVLISYYDSSGNTIGVVVTLRNSDKEIFSGQFASSKFEALVNDVPNTPHIIEMIVEHSVYGTLHASVYAPADSQDSIISGIFTKS
ncbi:MAG: hypothetical protein ACT4N1_05645 [Nitrososphaerota archaeon]